MNNLDKIPDFTASGPVSFRVYYPNEFGLCNWVFVYVTTNNPSEFMVEVEVRKPLTNGTYAIKQNKKWFPISQFTPFVEDLQARINN